jgi:arsenate reductase
MRKPFLLSYARCGTCRKALAWLAARKIAVDVRPIVERPPTLEELTEWVAKSHLPIRKWLHTSGGSYRAIGKAKIDAADDATIAKWLAADGTLVKRPVLVYRDRVLVGFREEEYAALFGAE